MGNYFKGKKYFFKCQYVSNSAMATMGILAVRADGDLCCRSGLEGRTNEGGSWERERGRGVEVGWGQPGVAQDKDAAWYRPTECMKATERAK